MKKDSIFLKEKTGIDYLDYIENYAKYTSEKNLTFPNTFAEDIGTAFNKLNSNIRKHLLNYIREKIKVVTDEDSIENLNNAYDIILEKRKLRYSFMLFPQDAIRWLKSKIRYIQRKLINRPRYWRDPRKLHQLQS